MTATALPSTDQVWDWLHQVPDPEIPVISLTDLGIIRDVAFEGETCVVTVTPTYSGCPATSIINLDIETALRGHPRLLRDELVRLALGHTEALGVKGAAAPGGLVRVADALRALRALSICRRRPGHAFVRSGGARGPVLADCVLGGEVLARVRHGKRSGRAR